MVVECSTFVYNDYMILECVLHLCTVFIWRSNFLYLYTACMVIECSSFKYGVFIKKIIFSIDVECLQNDKMFSIYIRCSCDNRIFTFIHLNIVLIVIEHYPLTDRVYLTMCFMYMDHHWGCLNKSIFSHDDVIKWKHFPRNWSFVRGIHRSRWIPHTKASDAERWCFLSSGSE